jgi:arylsulfatase
MPTRFAVHREIRTPSARRPLPSLVPSLLCMLLAAGITGSAAAESAAQDAAGPAAAAARGAAGTPARVLPPEPEPFAGEIGETWADSKPAFAPAITAPPGAPNILVVLTDDVGFGAASTFGGPIPTPNLDRLAEEGLTYNRFHTTAMCSPTRAALLTGRNHHAVHNGIVANLTTGFPGYDNVLPKSAATTAEVLRQNGFNTAMFGKHHNAPEHTSPPPAPSISGPPVSASSISTAS